MRSGFAEGAWSVLGVSTRGMLERMTLDIRVVEKMEKCAG
jgi:hypothetical protein